MRKMDQRQRSPFQMATIVVVNIILWMILISAIGMGTMHLNDCPIQPNIPVFLIVTGVFGLLSLMLTYTKNIFEEGGIYLLCSICSIISSTFVIFWLIAGSKWIYFLYQPNYDPLSKDGFCQKKLYLFAFGFTCVADLCLSLVLICTLLLLLVSCIKTLLQPSPGFTSYNRAYTEI
ncbi:transmembrane protein 272-like [Sardina pilchardus]|uniref:transmembrane protein 272-like n=1 Tax=Sardina pilchardus TaxID=27697 RepID=UPI002E0D2719